jgi:hypothetical protein
MLYRIYVEGAHVATVKGKSGIKGLLLRLDLRFCFAVGEDDSQVNCSLTPITNRLRFSLATTWKDQS